MTAWVVVALVAGSLGGVFVAALAAANRMSELRDENRDLRRRLRECTCREGA